MTDLISTTALVTGASRGIGRAAVPRNVGSWSFSGG
jgi:NAD(P)-dependent dehydrogenase (short-subunit alcohol dehydrogenase family)